MVAKLRSLAVRSCAALVLGLFLSSDLCAAQTVGQASAPERDAQAVSLLQNALAALSGGATIQDVTLDGTVRRIAGSLDESGTGTLKGTAAGASLSEFDLPSGTLEESRDISARPPAGGWEKLALSGAEGSGSTATPIAFHNLASDPTWFYPALLIERVLGNASYGIVDEGSATKDGVATIDVRINSYPLGPPGGANRFAQTLGQMDLYLDATTGLPTAIDFNAHPDDNGLVDVAVEVRFLNYGRQGGALVPSEIQRYLDNSLLLDIQVSSTQFNTGLTSANLSLR